MTKEKTSEFKREKLIGEGEINLRVWSLAKEIAEKYQGKNLLVVGVLKGAFILMADLVRDLHHHGLDDLEIDFVSLSSYGGDLESSRNPRVMMDLSTDISGRHVLLVEDIADTGYSLAALQKMLLDRGAASLETLVLLNKPSRREIKGVKLDYVGFKVVDWVEGFGLDTDQLGRGNPKIVKVITQ
jgi:hypoxanthine phosphoribosyltransferase